MKAPLWILRVYVSSKVLTVDFFMFPKCTLHCVHRHWFWVEVSRRSLCGVSSVCFSPGCSLLCCSGSASIPASTLRSRWSALRWWGPAPRLPWSWEGAGSLLPEAPCFSFAHTSAPGLVDLTSGRWKVSCSLLFSLGNLITWITLDIVVPIAGLSLLCFICKKWWSHFIVTGNKCLSIQHAYCTGILHSKITSFSGSNASDI